MAGGEPPLAGRTDAVCRTIYQPLRRYIDFFVLPRCCELCRPPSQPDRPSPPALLAQFLPDSFCARWELAGCATREGTAHWQHGRLPVHGPERHGVSRSRLHSGGNALETQWAQAGRTCDAP
jgi:hypothetical protein